MKHCTHCQDFALYDDEVIYCPICHNELQTYHFEEETIEFQEIQDSIQQQNHSSRQFEDRQSLYTLYHGSIIHVEHYHRIYPFFVKVIRSLFMNERFQFGYLSYYTNIIIEENRYDALPENQVSLVFNGDIAGKIAAGDEVDIRTKLNRNRISSMRISDTGERVRPAFSLPGWSLWLLILSLPLLIPLIIHLFIAMFTGLVSVSLSLLEVLLYPIIIIVAIVYIFRGLF